MKARFAALAALALASCGDYFAPDSVVFGNIVATQHAAAVNWSGYTTYSINPTVTVVDGTGTVMQTCTVDGTQLAANLKTLMEGRGYLPVDWNGTPATTISDLQLQMTAMIGDQDVYYTDWCGWYGYYYCYPGWTYAGSYTFGTLVVDMGDRQNVGTDNVIPLVWTDANYGVLASYYAGCVGSGTSVNWARINSAITRAFEQSPYIQK